MHITKNGTNMINELQSQVRANTSLKNLTSLPYGGNIIVDYQGTLHDVIKMVDQCRTLEARRLAGLVPSLQKIETDVSSLTPIGISLSSTNAIRSQREGVSPDIPNPSPLKRKHDVVDLT